MTRQSTAIRLIEPMVQNFRRYLDALWMVTAIMISCVACGGSGGAEAASTAGTGTSTASQYLFVTSFQHNTTGTLYVFRKSASDCSLTQISTHALGNNSFDLTYDSKGFLYVGNEGSSTVSVFRFNKDTGALTEVGTPVTQAGPHAQPYPYGIAIHSSGWVYIADGRDPGGVGYFQQNQTTGALTQIAPNFLATGAGNRAWFPALFPNTNYLYVTMHDQARVNIYTVNTGTGALAAHGTMSFIAAGTNPWEIVFHPTGNFIYAANYGSASVSQYSVQGDGTLVQIAAAATAGTNPISLAVGSSYLYAGAFNNGNAGAVYGYSINQTSGALTPTAQGSIAVPAPGVYGMALDKNANCLYAARSDYDAIAEGEDLRIFSVNSGTGALTAQGSMAAGAGPRFIKVAY